MRTPLRPVALLVAVGLAAGLSACGSDKPSATPPAATRQPDGLLPPSALGPLVRLGVRPEAADNVVMLACADLLAGVDTPGDRDELLAVARRGSAPNSTKADQVAMIREAVRVNCPERSADEAAFEAALGP